MYLNLSEIIIPLILFFIGLLNHYFLIREKRFDQKSFVFKLYLHSLLTFAILLLTPFDFIYSLLVLFLIYMSIILSSYRNETIFNLFFTKNK